MTRKLGIAESMMNGAVARLAQVDRFGMLSSFLFREEVVP
jgi:hypothetical protein